MAYQNLHEEENSNTIETSVHVGEMQPTSIYTHPKLGLDANLLYSKFHLDWTMQTKVIDRKQHVCSFSILRTSNLDLELSDSK